MTVTAAFWLETVWWLTFVSTALAMRRAWRKLPGQEVERLDDD